MNFKNFIRKLKSPYNYNIGFVDITPEDFIREKGFGKRDIKWIQHGYKDRWFADPFILGMNEKSIVVLAEEKEIGKKGIIVKLTIDGTTKKLIERTPLLELDTHLSYPAIIRYENKILIYPENGKSNSLSIYELENDRLLPIKELIKEPLCDATIFYSVQDKMYYLVATNEKIDPHNQLQLYKAQELLGDWVLTKNNPIVSNASISRPGGNFFQVDNQIYRVAQDCLKGYGNSIHILKVKSFSPFLESEVFQIKPLSYRYSKGIHTLNFFNSKIAVIDGNGYAYPIAGRIFGGILNAIQKKFSRL